MTLTGAPASVVRQAIETGDPLPGTCGFAGEIDGLLMRDVLGRVPLFFERDDPGRWDHSPNALSDPVRLPAGHTVDSDPTRPPESDGAGTLARVWSLPSPDPVDDDRAISGVRRAIDAALDTVVADGTSDLAIAFSGGIDSSILAARLDAPLYTVGFPESQDVAAARSGAALLDCDLQVVELDHATLEETVPAVVEATGRRNAMDVAIALPLFVLAKQVADDGIGSLALGQGADELFGGYAKVENAPDDHRVEADTIRGARRETIETLPDQFERDVLALRSAGVTPVTPLAHDRVVDAALRLDGHHLVRDGTRKWALREATRPWMPDELATRDKKALQYGTLVSRELDRLARQAGYKRRMDDHVGKYIDSLV